MSEHEIERMIVRIVGDSAPYIRSLREAEQTTKAVFKTIEHTATGIESINAKLNSFAASVKGYAQAALAMTGVASALESVKGAFSLAAEAEQNEIAFGVMLQNAKLGQQMVKDIQEFAAATPMDTSTLQSAAKTLLQFGIAGEDVMPTLKQLGDITGGQAEQFRSLTLAFGQMASTGRLMGEELNQMIGAGFNPLKEISKLTGKAMAELKDEMEKGRISVAMVDKAISSATSAGGAFHGMMELQSKSLGGLFSTLKDDWSAVLRTVGQELTETFKVKELIQSFSTFGQTVTGWFKTITPETRKWIATIFEIATPLAGVLIAWNVLIPAATRAGIAMVSAFTSATVAAAKYTLSLVSTQAALQRLSSNLAMGVVAVAGWALLRRETERLNKELARSVELAEKMSSKTVTNTELIFQEAGAIEDPGKRKSFLEEEQKKAQQEVEHLSANLERLKKVAEEVAPPAILDWGPWNDELEVQNKLIEDAKKKYDDWKARADQLKKSLKELAAAGGPTPEAAKKAKEFLADLEKQAGTIGKTTEQAKIWEMQQLKVADSTIHAMRALAQFNEEAKKRAELEKDLKKLADSLKEDIATFGLSGDAAKLWGLEQRGASDEALQHVKALMAQKDALDQHKETLERAAQITRDAMTPFDKYQQTMQELDDLLEGSFISEDTYFEAVRKANEELEKSGKEAEKAAKAYERFDQAASGSAEALSRIAAFKDARLDETRAAAEKRRKLAEQEAERLRKTFGLGDEGVGGEWDTLDRGRGGGGHFDPIADLADRAWGELEREAAIRAARQPLMGPRKATALDEAIAAVRGQSPYMPVNLANILREFPAAELEAEFQHNARQSREFLEGLEPLETGSAAAERDPNIEQVVTLLQKLVDQGAKAGRQGTLTLETADLD